MQGSQRRNIHFKKRSWAFRVDVAMYNVVLGTAPVIRRITRQVARAPTRTIQVARYALMAIFRPILLAALAFAVMASSVPISASALSDVLAAGAGAGRVTRFVCAHCTSTGQTVFEPGSGPAPHCCFKAMPRCGRRHPDHPSRGSPGRRRHGRRGWGGGARTGRPTPAGRCFPSFASSLVIPFKSRSGINAGGAVVEQPCSMHEVLGSNPTIFFILPILI